MALIHALETKQAEVNALREQSKQADVDIAKSQAAQAASKAESDKYNAAQADAIARQKEADAAAIANEAAKLQSQNDADQIKLKAAEAEAESNRAATTQILLTSFVAVIAIGTIALLRLVTLRTQEAVAAYQESEPAQPVTHYVDDTRAERVPPPPSGITEQWLMWAHLARCGQSVAYNKMTGAGQPYKNSDDYRPIYDWAWRNKIIGRDVNGATIITKRGEQYLDDELQHAKYSAPAPGMDESQIVPPANHTQDNPEHDNGGEVVAGLV
jgi:hypothetical protein